jgi:hypothetical protein
MTLVRLRSRRWFEHGFDLLNRILQRRQRMERHSQMANDNAVAHQLAVCPHQADGLQSNARNSAVVAVGAYPRPAKVFLDGDQTPIPECTLLPGGESPEIVVFNKLKEIGWDQLADRTGRPFAEVADACTRATSLANHHDWVSHAASQLQLAGETLWQAMCAIWATKCLPKTEAMALVQGIQDLFLATPETVSSPTVRLPLFERSQDAFADQER